ncbi:aldehyde dehydrogenase [Serinicoccus chungangensis]|uniref:Aldehyde dehydrogenase n=1 Tax=Serinicoccus chungangensis TaxID=767452 RepID=A0A0W8I8H5_9MICO|nr:aldehyde dehydrogenase family protein [Serinicoccus chungangensis]KUG55707.1 aldehyde dehydrogenase [Serinicoccus chungangensis]
MPELTLPLVAGSSLAVRDTYDNVDPADGSVLGQVARGGAEEVDEAVRAAAQAQPAWAATPTEQRADALTRLADLVDRDREQLAHTESQDTGKPLSQARADATVAARYFRYYGRVVEAAYGDTIPLGPDTHVYTRREPYGVVGSIVAWNYPLQLASRSIAAATATGNAVVLKPADETPRTAVALAALAMEAGLPAGVVNVVPGLGAEAGAALTAHPQVAHLGFVGSTQTGRQVAHAAAERVVPAVLELGGKSAHVVFPDADLDAAAEAITRSILQNAGQTCSAGSRLVVHEDIRAELVAAVAERFGATTLGPGLDDPDLGPLVSRRQQDRVRGYVEGVASGEVVVGGTAPPQDGDLAAGAFWLPTLVDGVDPRDPIAQEEVFGPVLVTLPFEDEAQALELANGTAYGLIAALWTRDLSRAHRLAGALEAGQVFVNTFGAGGGVELPFGGVKASGYGREKGVEALAGFTHTKTVVVRLG